MRPRHVDREMSAYHLVLTREEIPYLQSRPYKQLRGYQLSPVAEPGPFLLLSRLGEKGKVRRSGILFERPWRGMQIYRTNWEGGGEGWAPSLMTGDALEAGTRLLTSSKASAIRRGKGENNRSCLGWDGRKRGSTNGRERREENTFNTGKYSSPTFFRMSSIIQTVRDLRGTAAK